MTLARRALGVSRIGHTGTLDPMATGVLPLVIGRATRLAQFLTASDKTYEATIAFGRTTDTYDATGREVVPTCDRRPTREQLDAALDEVSRHVRADAAAYSAKNIDGERSYELARETKRRGGFSAAPRARKPCTVTARRLEVAGVRRRDRAALDASRRPASTSAPSRTTWEALGCGAMLSHCAAPARENSDSSPRCRLADVLAEPRATGGEVVPMRHCCPTCRR